MSEEQVKALKYSAYAVVIGQKENVDWEKKKKVWSTWTSCTPEDFLVITLFLKLLNQCFHLAKINIISCVWPWIVSLSLEGIFTTCKQTLIMEILTNLTIMMLVACIFQFFSSPLLQDTNVHSWPKFWSWVPIRASQTFAAQNNQDQSSFTLTWLYLSMYKVSLY